MHNETRAKVGELVSSMTKRGLVDCIAITCALLTLPFLVVGYGYSKSTTDFWYGIVKAMITIPDLSKLMFNVLFFAPWLYLVSSFIFRGVKLALRRK